MTPITDAESAVGTDEFRLSDDRRIERLLEGGIE
jgi:hypothetical protein